MVDNELRDLIINDHSSYNLNLIWIEDLVFESIKVGKKSYGDIFAYYVECEKVHGINYLYIFFHEKFGYTESMEGDDGYKYLLLMSFGRFNKGIIKKVQKSME